ncbi:MAG: hypothetical protein ACON5B_15370 [Myxococcota bacterium]
MTLSDQIETAVMHAIHGHALDAQAELLARDAARAVLAAAGMRGARVRSHIQRGTLEVHVQCPPGVPRIATVRVRTGRLR